MAILQGIKSHEDLKKLSLEEMETLAEEVREKIVEVVAKNGGHLSPNLGVVELTIALNRVFDFAKDKIVWDVGHQCYTHKLLTGRQKVFHTLRLEDGIAGFPRREESEYDHFDTGHAGTSISAALGFAAARDLKSEKYNVVAFIGDGSMTSGLSFEGLNNAGALQSDLIVILNDNEMSISPNVGALSAHLNRIISGELFNRMRGEVDHILSLIPGVGRQVTNFTHRVEEAIKGIFVPGRIFEDFGFKYFGPIEGHNFDAMLNTFESVKKLKGPRLIHVVTRKGRGYKPAEEKPGLFHGTGPFDVKTGKKKPSAKKASFTSIFARTLTEIAEEDEKVIAITAAMREGTGLMEFAEKFPERLFDVGIAEQHAVTFAGAMAIEGFKPVVAIYSTFLQRAFDQVIHDVCKTGLPVTFAVDRAGIVGADGSTHQGLFDLSFLREVPNMTVMAPKDENELRHMIFTAINHNGPIAIRYPRGNVMGVALDQELKEIKIGEAELLKEGRDILICAIGNRVSDSLAAAHSLEKKGCSAAVINARFAKPIDIKLISTWAKECGTILTVEENSVVGGFGSGVFEALRNTRLGSIEGETLGVPDMFVQHGPQESKRSQLGIDAEGIVKKALEMLKKPGKISTVARQAEAHRLQ